jgi:hypothetical protein
MLTHTQLTFPSVMEDRKTRDIVNLALHHDVRAVFTCLELALSAPAATTTMC